MSGYVGHLVAGAVNWFAVDQLGKIVVGVVAVGIAATQAQPLDDFEVAGEFETLLLGLACILE